MYTPLATSKEKLMIHLYKQFPINTVYFGSRVHTPIYV